ATTPPFWFFTNPDSPQRAAKLWTKGRNPTPWTIPRTAITRRFRTHETPLEPAWPSLLLLRRTAAGCQASAAAGTQARSVGTPPCPRHTEGVETAPPPTPPPPCFPPPA